MPEAVPGTECRQHMVSLSTRWYAVSRPSPVSPPVPSSQLNARKMLVGAAAQSQDISCDTAWERVKRGAEATKMHQKHSVKALRAPKCPCNVTECWGRRLAKVGMC